MKLKFVVLILMIISIKANAQLSTIKAGINLNADKVDYASWEISFERLICKKYSFNLTYNYAQPHKEGNNFTGDPTSFGTTGFTNFNHTIILEGRYYLKSNISGIFFQLGIPFTYSIEESFYTSPAGDGSTKHDYLAICTIAGFGLKYPISNKFGVEMNMNISPSFNFLDVDYGTSGFIKTGVKLYFTLDKSSHAKLQK
jgi:hypothetical protein